MKAGRVLLGALVAFALAASPAAAERTIVMRAGPFKLSSFSTVRPKVIVRSAPVNGYLLRMHARVVDGSGHAVTVQKVMLHHIVFINRGRFDGDRQQNCGARFGEPFYGTGEENETLRFPSGYGYKLRKGDKWLMQTMLMNHSFHGQKVWVEYTMRTTTAPRTPVTPYWVRVTNCHNDPSWSVPGGKAPGSVSIRTHIWRAPATGLIVAAGSHLHGGSYDIALRQMDCRGRRLFDSPPVYGMPDDVMYNLKPVLHEPGPMSTGWFESARGIPVRKGEPLRASAAYDAQLPHMGVMGVLHIYIAQAPKEARKARASSRCAALPDDARVLQTAMPHRTGPPPFVIPLQTLSSAMTPVTLDHPSGRLYYFQSRSDRPVVKVANVAFSPVNMSIASGTTITWRFMDAVAHKVILANGPRAMGSPTLTRGIYKRRLSVPGVYQLFCPLHPVTMHQEITVRPRGA